MKMSESLYKAADYIADNGHYKGAMLEDEEDPNSSACMVGAVVRVRLREHVGEIWNNGDSILDITKYITTVTVGNASGLLVGKWNDRDETTAEDAILVLKKAAYLAEEEGN